MRNAKDPASMLPQGRSSPADAPKFRSRSKWVVHEVGDASSYHGGVSSVSEGAKDTNDADVGEGSRICRNSQYDYTSHFERQQQPSPGFQGGGREHREHWEADVKPIEECSTMLPSSSDEEMQHCSRDAASWCAGGQFTRWLASYYPRYPQMSRSSSDGRAREELSRGNV
eukprot:g2858.t1